MNQPSLPFDAPRARNTDPDTSRAAARRVTHISSAISAQVLDLLGRHRYGLTKDQVCERLGVEPRYWPTVASALSRLKGKGWLEWNGQFQGQNIWQLVAEVVPVEVASEVL